MKRLIFLSVVLLSVHAAQAQDSWDLRKCIEYAQEHSLNVKLASLQTANTSIDYRQAKLSRMPTVNGNLGNTLNFGRSVDMTSYQFVQQAIYFNNIGLDANMVLYSGNRIKNSIRQSDINRQANEQNEQQIKEDIALQVAQAYLSILLAQESVNLVKDQDKQTKAQLDQTQKLVAAGAAPANATLELEAQLARNEQSLVGAENSVELAYFTLKQLMNIDLAADIKISAPAFVIPDAPLLPQLEAVYQLALNRQPEIRAGELREESAKMGIDIAKSQGLPTVAAFAGLSTNYSSVGKRITGYETVDIPLGDVVTPLGTFPVTAQSNIPISEANPYFNQIDQNFNQRIGVSVSIPIYNQGQTKLGMERAKLAVESAESNTEILRIQLKSDIARAIADARAAHKRWQAARKSVETAEQSQSNIEKRFNIGSSNAFELNTAQNNVMIARSELISAKFDYVFRLKILDFYQGKPINLISE